MYLLFLGKWVIIGLMCKRLQGYLTNIIEDSENKRIRQCLYGATFIFLYILFCLIMFDFDVDTGMICNDDGIGRKEGNGKY